MDKVKLNVLGLSYSQANSGAYALVLAEDSGEKRIPIIIGSVEAQSIAIQLEGLTPPRPLTHDLFISMADAFSIKVEEVFIYKLHEGVFYSELVCYDGKNRIRIDSRTSDAVSLALRFHCPIFTSQEIIDKAGIILEGESVKEEEPSTQVPFSAKPDKSSLASGFSNLDTLELNARLKEAIEAEDYELASLLRDELNKREA